ATAAPPPPEPAPTPGAGPAREPPLQQHRQHGNRDRCEHQLPRPGGPRPERVPKYVVADRKRERGENRAPRPQHGGARPPLRGPRTSPARPTQHDREQGEHDPNAALPLQNPIREAVAARDLERVVRALRTDLRARIRKQQPDELDDSHYH